MLQHEYVEQPARALLTHGCKRRQFSPVAKREPSQGQRDSTDAIDLLLPPEILRAERSSSTPVAGQTAPAVDCTKISQWVDRTCGLSGISGAFVAVLGSCYGGILGFDQRSPGMSSSLPIGGGYGWLGCHPDQSYVNQLLSKPVGIASQPSALVTACFNLDPVNAGLGPLSSKLLQSPLLPIRSNSCDAVVALGVLDQLSTVTQRERFVVEALRLLRPPQGFAAGGEACFEAVAAPPRHLTHDCGADLLVPVHVPGPASNGAAGGSFHEVFFHTFADGELEELVNSCASKMAPELEVEIVWSEKQRGGGTHACVVRRVR